MSFTLPFALVALCAIFFFAAAFLAKKPHWGTGAQIVQALVTSAALALAGYFYFIERRGQPHADVTQTVQSIGLPNGNVAIEASVLVKNLGNQLLRINHLRSSLQVVDLDLLGLTALPTTNEDYWNATDVVNGQQLAAFQETEMQWPILRLYDGRVDHEIEPGESDLITETFLIPCQSARFARVATDVEKLPQSNQTSKAKSKGVIIDHFFRAVGLASGKPGESLTWKARSLVDLGPACQKGQSQ